MIRMNGTTRGKVFPRGPFIRYAGMVVGLTIGGIGYGSYHSS